MFLQGIGVRLHGETVLKTNISKSGDCHLEQLHTVLSVLSALLSMKWVWSDKHIMPTLNEMKDGSYQYSLSYITQKYTHSLLFNNMLNCCKKYHCFYKNVETKLVWQCIISRYYGITYYSSFNNTVCSCIHLHTNITCSMTHSPNFNHKV
jgi:hypothetical protein